MGAVNANCSIRTYAVMSQPASGGWEFPPDSPDPPSKQKQSQASPSKPKQTQASPRKPQETQTNPSQPKRAQAIRSNSEQTEANPKQTHAPFKQTQARPTKPKQDQATGANPSKPKPRLPMMSFGTFRSALRHSPHSDRGQDTRQTGRLAAIGPSRKIPK